MVWHCFQQFHVGKNTSALNGGTHGGISITKTDVTVVHVALGATIIRAVATATGRGVVIVVGLVAAALVELVLIASWFGFVTGWFGVVRIWFIRNIIHGFVGVATLLQIKSSQVNY